MITVACALAVALATQVPDRLNASDPKESRASNRSGSEIHPREREIFKEWAKGIRESVDASRKMTSKRPPQREAWAMKSAKSKEDRIRKRYRLDLYRLFLILKRGVEEEWPTERPEDRSVIEPIVAQRQAFLDSMIFEEELNAWVAAHSPSRAGSTQGLLEFSQSLQQSINDSAELRKRAPITVCGSKLQNGGQCTRKVVGNPGRHCYEHRSPTDETPIPPAEAKVGVKQDKNAAELSRIEEAFKKTGISQAKREEIFRALCLAELRAQREADQRFPLQDNPQENLRYHDTMTPKYERAVYEKYGITTDQADLISLEAHYRKWPLPRH